MLFTLLVVCNFGNGFALLSLCGVFSAAFVISLVFRKIRQVAVIPTVFLGVAVACLLLFFSDFSYNHTLNYKGENLQIKGVVCELPQFKSENGRHYCVVKLTEISGEKASGKIRLSFSETYDGINHEDFEIGDKVSFTANVYESGEGTERIQRYFRSKDIALGAYRIRNLKNEKPLLRGIYHYASLLRMKATDIILRHFSSDTAGLMIAVLSGDKSYISDEFYDNSCYAGVIHLMAVSGLHLSVWVFFIGGLLSAKEKKSRVIYLLMVFCVIFIMNFASMTGSVRRAGFMALLYLFGKIADENSDPLNSLGFALTVVLFQNPYSVYDVGFMLSLFSTLGILVVAFPLGEKLLKNKKTLFEGTLKLKIITSVTESILVNLSVAVFTLPIMTYYFGYISSVSAITNLLILPFCMPLVVASGLFAMFSSLPLLSTALGLFCRYVAAYVIKVVTFMGSLSFAKIHLNYDFLFPFLIFCGFGVFLCLVVKGKTVRKLVAAVISLTFVICFTSEYIRSFSTYKITDFSSGGTCYVVSVRNKGVVVGLSGDYYVYDNILDFAERTGVKIEAVLPDENAEYLNLNYAEYELGAKIIEGDCRISLYGVAEIVKQGDTVSVLNIKDTNN